MTAVGLGDFLDRVAGATPTPAAGATAALTGAASAALVAKVTRVTARRAAPSDELTEIEAEAESLRARLTSLVQEDSDAFTAVLAARRLSGEERPGAVHASLIRATEVPVEIARAAGGVLALGDRLAPSARASTVSDLGVAVTLAAAVLDGAVLTARVNLLSIEDPAFVARTRAQLAALAAEGAAMRERVARLVSARTGVGQA